MSFEPLFIFLGILADIAHQCEPMTSIALCAGTLGIGFKLGDARRARDFARDFVLVPRRNP